MNFKRVQKGDQVRDFNAETYSGETISLSQFKGQKVWLSFYRYASCPLCNLRINQMIKRYSEFSDAGLNIIAVFQSSKESVSEYVGQQHPPFPLVTDPEEKLYKLYGLEHSLMAMLNPYNILTASKAFAAGFYPGKMEGTITRIPADFLIDENGIVQTVFYGENVGDHISFKEVDFFLKS